MPRVARQKSRSGIYHVMFRGINKQIIFHDDEDHMRFLGILDRYKKTTKLKIHGWCLMNNHVHLLLAEGDEELAITLKRIAVSYASFYNSKYEKIGHLFQDRFRSENVEDQQYFLTVLRYIHRNPVKANLADNLHDWEWSSYSEYLQKSKLPLNILDGDYALGFFSEDKDLAVKRFREFNEQEACEDCLEDQGKGRLSDREARLAISEIVGETFNLKDLARHEKNGIILKVSGIVGISQRQISKILGIANKTIKEVVHMGTVLT